MESTFQVCIGTQLLGAGSHHRQRLSQGTQAPGDLLIRLRTRERGDKGDINAQCTSPEAIVSRMASCTGQGSEQQRTWVFGIADDPTRIAAYQAELRSVAAKSGMGAVRIIFEDEILEPLATQHSARAMASTGTGTGTVAAAASMTARNATSGMRSHADNSVSFAVSQLLMRDATVQVETHYCSYSNTHACHAMPQLLSALGSDGEQSSCLWPRSSTSAFNGTGPTSIAGSVAEAVQCACAYARSSTGREEQHKACKHVGKRLSKLAASDGAPSNQSISGSSGSSASTPRKAGHAERKRMAGHTAELEWILEAQLWAKTLGLALWVVPIGEKGIASGPMLRSDVVCRLLNNMSRRGGSRATIQPVRAPQRFHAACAVGAARDPEISPIESRVR